MFGLSEFSFFRRSHHPFPPAGQRKGERVHRGSLNGQADPRFSWLLDFTLESAGEALEITRAYRRRRDGGEAHVPGSPERYDCGVE